MRKLILGVALVALLASCQSEPQMTRDQQLDSFTRTCARYGFQTATPEMSNCMMRMDEGRRQEAMQASQQENANTQQFIQRQQQRNNEFYNNLRESSNQQMQQSQQRRYQPAPVKNTDFACMSNCQNAGYQYGLCQSKCSY